MQKEENDPYFDGENGRRLKRAIWGYEQGEPSLQLTMDELNEMAGKGQTLELSAKITAFRKAHAEWIDLHPYPGDDK